MEDRELTAGELRHLLAVAEDAFRDIGERLEHAGTCQKLMTDTRSLLNWYWSRKAGVLAGGEATIGVQPRDGRESVRAVPQLFAAAAARSDSAREDAKNHKV